MEGNDWSAVDPRLTPIGFQESYREYVHISEHIEARQWRVLLEWSGFPAPFVVFQNPLLPRLVYTQFYSVVSLTASHDSRWNAKNTVEGFSSPLFLSPLAISSPARLSTVASAIAQTARFLPQRPGTRGVLKKTTILSAPKYANQEKRESISINPPPPLVVIGLGLLNVRTTGAKFKVISLLFLSSSPFLLSFSPFARHQRLFLSR